MKLKFFFILLTLGATLTLSAFSPSDPQDPIYQDLARWESLGIVGPLPLLKPYNLPFLKSILSKVATSGGIYGANAEVYLKGISEGLTLSPSRLVSNLNLAKGGEFPEEPIQGDTDLFALGGFYLGTNSLFSDLAGITGYFGALGMDQGRSLDGKGTTYSIGTRSPFDFYVDDSAFELKGRSVLLTLSMGGLISFGNENLWFQGGLHRSSMGPFTEGIILTEQAPQSAAFSLTWNTQNFIYTKYLLGLAATKDNKSFQGNFQDYYPNKYLSGQSFQFLFGETLELSLFEEVVFGQRFEPYYLIPVMSSLYTSIYTGMKDNILVGASATVKLPGNLRWTALFNADDLHFLKLLMLDTSGKTKIAFNTGVHWTPAQVWLDNLSFDYALVTPYTFTHAVESIDGVDSDINYVNYTHQGKGLAGLEPNSDRVRLKAQWRGSSVWSIFLEARLNRHGNASSDFSEYGPESKDFVGTSDGGFNDNGYVSPGGDHRYNSNHFLTQDAVETLFRTTIGGSLSLDSFLGTIDISSSYGLEQGWNRRGLQQLDVIGAGSETWTNGGTPIKGNDGLMHYLQLSLGLSF